MWALFACNHNNKIRSDNWLKADIKGPTRKKCHHEFGHRLDEKNPVCLRAYVSRNIHCRFISMKKKQMHNAEDKWQKIFHLMENLMWNDFWETHTSLQAISRFLPLTGSLEFWSSAWKSGEESLKPSSFQWNLQNEWQQVQLYAYHNGFGFEEMKLWFKKTASWNGFAKEISPFTKFWHGLHNQKHLEGRDSLLNSLKDILTGGLAHQLTVVPLEAYQRKCNIGGCFADISLYSIYMLASATLSATPHSASYVYNLT